MRIATLLCCAGVLAALQEGLTEEKAKKVVPTGTGFARKEVALSPAAREAYKKVAGVDAPEKLVTFVAKAKFDFGDEKGNDIRIVAIPVQTAKGPAELGVAVASKDKFVAAVKLLAHKEEKSVETAAFLKQYEGLNYTDKSMAQTAEDLQSAIKKAAEAKDDEGKTLRALLQMARLMNQIGPLDEALTDRLKNKDAGGTAEAQKMTVLFKDAAKVADDARFLGADEAQKFKGFLDVTLKGLGDLESAVKAKDFDKANSAYEALMCDKCHGSFRKPFREGRRARGIGNGHFRPGLDLTIDPNADEQTQQAIGEGVRRAVLLVKDLE